MKVEIINLFSINVVKNNIDFKQCGTYCNTALQENQTIVFFKTLFGFVFTYVFLESFYHYFAGIFFKISSKYFQNF